MDLKLKGKRAFISGSTQGIGFAIAQQLIKEGVDVTINGRHKLRTEKSKEKLQEQFPNANISAISADFSKKEEVEELLTQLEDIDILVNNVGIFDVKDFGSIVDEDWYQCFEINVSHCQWTFQVDQRNRGYRKHHFGRTNLFPWGCRSN